MSESGGTLYGSAAGVAEAALANCGAALAPPRRGPSEHPSEEASELPNDVPSDRLGERRSDQARDRPSEWPGEGKTMRYAILTTGAPLEAWQEAVVANLAATSSAQGEGWLLPSQSAAALAERHLDFILSFAPASAGREFLRAARCGVWQFFFGDWARYRGESEGFWEIVDNSDVATAVLAQLQEDPAAVRILVSGSIRTHAASPAATVRNLRRLALHWPRQACMKMLDGSMACFERAPVYTTAPARRRKLPDRIAFMARAAARLLRDQFRQLTAHEQWNIGLLDAPIASLLEPRGPLDPHWLQTPGRREFFADPIGVVHDGRSMIFCEHLDYRGGIGRIRAFDAGAPARVHAVDIGPPVHLSYPFLFEDAGALYCIPESCGANEVALYAVERFPDRWRRVATLIPGVPLIDVTPFRYGERWWLAASLPAPRGANCELHLYYADALAGPWQPHAANPVKVDIRSARPGGTPFWKDGVFYRPAQDCSGTYGQRVVINRVSRLTTRCFEEEPAAVVEPPRTGAYRAGLHTVSALGDRTLIDAKRHIFVPQECWRVFKLGLRKHAVTLQGRFARASRAA